jgi:hypothetical protein
MYIGRHRAVLNFEWERRDMYTELWWENLKESDHLEDLGLVGRIIL